MSFPLFLIPIAASLIAQLIKPFINKGWYLHFVDDGSFLPRYGGMPSAHTAFAFSLLTLVVMTDGINSTLFAIAAAVAIFILDDALRMRIFLGRHGEALRRLIHQRPLPEQKDYPHLEAQLGHKLPEVLAGAALGIILTLAIMLMIGY